MGISQALRTRAVGYEIQDQVFNPTADNLPMAVALFGEPNTAEEATLDKTPYEITSASDAGSRYGYGSPIHQVARILFPISGGGVGAVPVTVYPQEFNAAATATELVLSITGTATKTVSHKLIINGRDNIDGKYYEFVVTKGDTATDVIASIVDAVSNVLSAPVSAVGNAADVTFTSKWKGLTSADITIEVSYEDAAGVVYAAISKTDGTTTPDITDGISAAKSKWNTIYINTYGTVKLSELETLNGTPTSKTGKYDPTVFKPFVALFGSTLSDKEDLVAITNADDRKDQVTNVLCPAPNSDGMPYEAAANYCVLQATIGNDSPQIGIGGLSLPDMPVPTDGLIGDMEDIVNRNYCMIRGCSTVLLENGKYTIQDFVTTFAPDGVTSPKFKFSRDLIIDWNVGYNWKIIVIRDIQDKAIVSNSSAVNVGNTVSPKQVKALLIGLIENSASNAWINDTSFSIANITVGVNSSNPARLDIAFKYKRTSTANQISTEAAVDFSYDL